MGNSCSFFNRECSSTLYVGLEHVVPPTNTKIKPLFLPTQAGTPYKNTNKHRISYFKSALTFLGPVKRWDVHYCRPTKMGNCCNFFTLYVGLALVSLNASLKSTETRDELQLPAILCQDACQRLMLHPYITASRTSSQN